MEHRPWRLQIVRYPFAERRGSQFQSAAGGKFPQRSNGRRRIRRLDQGPSQDCQKIRTQGRRRQIRTCFREEASASPDRNQKKTKAEFSESTIGLSRFAEPLLGS